MGADGTIPVAVHAQKDAQYMEEVYQKYNPELMAGAGPAREEPKVLAENLELVSAVQNLNAMSHQFGLDPTIQMMGVNITESTPQRSASQCQNTPSAVGTAGPASQQRNMYRDAESPPKQPTHQMDQFSTLYPSPPRRAAQQSPLAPRGEGKAVAGGPGTANERPVPLEVSPKRAPMNPARGDLSGVPVQ